MLVDGSEVVSWYHVQSLPARFLQGRYRASSRCLRPIYFVHRLFCNPRTTQYLHKRLYPFGFDERQESMACFHEVGTEPDFDSFENNLAAVLSLEGISTERILRWENQERRDYPGRVGSITHCRSGDCRSSSNRNNDVVYFHLHPFLYCSL
jgi:hypothetical protein